MGIQAFFNGLRRTTLLFLGLLVACGGGDGGTSTAPTAVSSSATIASVRVTPETAQISAGQTVALTAQALDSAGNVISGKTFAFVSLNTAAGTVASTGANTATVTAVAVGVARIRASTEGVQGDALVTVGVADIQATGRVIDGQTQAGLAGARVEFENGQTAITAADGSYSYTFAGNGSVTYTRVLIASATGYVSTRIFAVIRADSPTIGTMVLVKQNATSGSVSGVVRNARDNSPIPNVTVQIGPDQGFAANTSQATTNAQGVYTFPNLPAGTYTVAAFASGTATGYRFCDRTAISVGVATPVNQDLVCSPIGSNEIRIVLNWGSTPRDIDAHLTGPNADASRFHVYYPPGSRGSSSAAPFAVLDRDDTDSVGPETITITKLNSGVYRFTVHDFTNKSLTSSSALGASGATVQVYFPVVEASGFTRRDFQVPNQPGNLWTVFEMTGPIDRPTVTPRNEMRYLEDEATIQ